MRRVAQESGGGVLILPRSIRPRSPAAPKGGAEEKGRVTPLRMTGLGWRGKMVRGVEIGRKTAHVKAACVGTRR
jgi:hypothetical protein